MCGMNYKGSVSKNIPPRWESESCGGEVEKKKKNLINFYNESRRNTDCFPTSRFSQRKSKGLKSRESKNKALKESLSARGIIRTALKSESLDQRFSFVSSSSWFPDMKRCVARCLASFEKHAQKSLTVFTKGCRFLQPGWVESHPPGGLHSTLFSPCGGPDPCVHVGSLT